MAKTLRQEIVYWQKSTLKEREIIIRQYTEVTRLLNELFSLAPDQCYVEDGIGCCHIGTIVSESGITGPAYITLLRMRQARLEEEGLEAKVGSELDGPCSYHKEGYGCVLGELKSPLCMSNYCDGVLNAVGYDQDYVDKTLVQILQGGFNPETRKYHPEQNLPLVEQFKVYVRSLMETAKTMKKA